MITEEDLTRLVSYNPDTGIFHSHTWIKQGRIGDVLGKVNREGYLEVRLLGRVYALHRLAFLYMTKEFPPKGSQVDHKNEIKVDNRWSNLRLATNTQNSQNKKITGNNTSGVKGLSFSSEHNSWRAAIKKDGKPQSKTLTLNDRIEKEVILELETWLRIKRLELHGEFTNLG